MPEIEQASSARSAAQARKTGSAIGIGSIARRCDADNATIPAAAPPENTPSDPELRKGAWRQLVLRDDFLIDNYLSDDERYPLSELGTNAARAMGTNAMAGHMWGQMSSLSYKQMKEEPVALRDHDKDFNPIDLYNPLTGEHDIQFTAPKAYYRTPSLVSTWATAPSRPTLCITQLGSCGPKNRHLSRHSEDELGDGKKGLERAELASVEGGVHRAPVRRNVTQSQTEILNSDDSLLPRPRQAPVAVRS
jgi:hypothetical protein